MDELDITNIPIQIEGVNIEIAPNPSSSHNIKNDNDGDHEIEDEYETESKEKDKKATIKKESSRLDTYQKALMGEANLRFARGDIETAKKMCFEVIRQCPEAYEPYLTLAQMYEGVNLKKHKGFLMLASYLSVSNTHIIVRLAELYVQEGDIKNAIKCYSRGIKHFPKDMMLHQKRLELIEKMYADSEQKKMYLTAKQTMANNMPVSQHESMINLVMEVAKEHFHNRNYIRAIEALRIPLRRIPDKVTKDVINMMLELLILNERFSECLDVFTQFCGFTFDIIIVEDNHITVSSYVMPESLQIDLKCQFIIFLVKVKADHLYPELIDKMLMEDNVDDVGDLYLDIADALMATGAATMALKLLVPLTKSKTYSQPAVWLKYAECLSMCQMVDMAIEAYYTVKSMAPTHIEMLYPLAKLLIHENKKDDALKVLSQDVSTDKLDVAVLMEKMKLLKQIDDWEGYWQCVDLLLSRHCIMLKNYEELKVAITHKSYKEKVVDIRRLRNYRSENCDIETEFLCIREPSVEEEFRLYRDILQMAMDHKEYSQCQRLTFMGMTSKRFTKYRNELYIIALYSSLYNNDTCHAYHIIKELLLKHPRNNICWTLLNKIGCSSEDLRPIRFLDRQQKLPMENRDLMFANNQLPYGNCTMAINYYTKEFKKNGQPFFAFLLGVAMLQYYYYKSLDKNKRKVLSEALTYLFHYYARIRSSKVEQEVFYNLGRVYQQLGIGYLAEYYYLKVFEVSNELLKEHPDVLCLKRPAAYNLHLLYKNSGNYEAARKLLYEHVVV